MKWKLPAALFGLALCTASLASAAEDMRPRLVGSWKLVSVYDVFTDGTKRNTWGADAQGLVVFTPEGTFSAIIVAADRTPKPGTVPTDPVGPAIAYSGTYSVDEAARSFAARVTNSTFPPWQGQTLVRKVEDLSADRLTVVAAPITDPSGHQYVPHLELARVK